MDRQTFLEDKVGVYTSRKKDALIMQAIQIAVLRSRWPDVYDQRRPLRQEMIEHR